MLRHHEGVRTHAYKCTASKTTIGVGRNIDVKGGIGLSADEINYLLANDVKRVNAELSVISQLATLSTWATASDFWTSSPPLRATPQTARGARLICTSCRLRVSTTPANVQRSCAVAIALQCGSAVASTTVMCTTTARLTNRANSARRSCKQRVARARAQTIAASCSVLTGALQDGEITTRTSRQAVLPVSPDSSHPLVRPSVPTARRGGPTLTKTPPHRASAARMGRRPRQVQQHAPS